MLKTSSSTGSSTILPLINVADEVEIGDSKSGGNKTNLLNPSASNKSTRAGYLTSRGTKMGGGKSKKEVKAAKSPNYLNQATKKAFNHLRHVFT